MIVEGNITGASAQPEKSFAWTNGAELDALLALNQKINDGATLDSLRTNFAEKEKAAADAEGKKLQILHKNRRSFRKAPILWQLLRKRLVALMCNPLQ